MVFLGTKIVNVGTNEVKLGIWDTAGQEKFHSLGEIYYRNSDVCLLVYDVCEDASFKKMDVWYKELKNNLGDKVYIIIVANKIDKRENRIIPEDQGRSYSTQRNCDYVEISCKTGDNITKLMDLLIKKVHDYNSDTNVNK